MCAVVVSLGDQDSPGRVPASTVINDGGATMDEEAGEWLNSLIPGG